MGRESWEDAGFYPGIFFVREQCQRFSHHESHDLSAQIRFILVRVSPLGSLVSL